MHKGIAEGEFRPVEPGTFRSLNGRDDRFLFQQRPSDAAIVRFNPLTPQRIAERRAAVLDFVAAALFQPVPARSLLHVKQHFANQEYANERP